MATKVVIISDNKEFSEIFSNFSTEIAATQQGLREIHTFYQLWLSENDTAPTAEEVQAYRAISLLIDYLASADMEVKTGLSVEERIKQNDLILAEFRAKQQENPTAAEGNVR